MEEMVDEIKPVIKWAGGKTQLIPVLSALLPDSYNRYFEPFFGGGALFCSLYPKNAVINDLNPQLINVYRSIQESPELLIEELYSLQEIYNNKSSIEEKDAFYFKQRDRFNECILNNEMSYISAALFIFINKSCFNGLYRVNSFGKYNVSSAHKKKLVVCNKNNIREFSKALKNTNILCGDFEKACESADAGDLVFFDSPYYNTFDTYQAGGFSERDHVRLFHLFDQLSKKGVYCILTNNDCSFIKGLYSGYNILSVDVNRMINCDGSNRKGKEFIITNYYKDGRRVK